MISRIIQYIIHFFTSPSTRGHGIHSPWLYDFVTKCLNSQSNSIHEIEQLRTKRLNSNELLNITDYGAGSKINPSKQRTVAEVTKYSTSIKKNLLLYRIAQYINPQYIIEFGTSLGFSTLYMSYAKSTTPIKTVEGCPETAAIANANFSELKRSNIEIAVKPFDQFIEKLDIPKGKTLVLIDGDHTYEGTKKYFDYFYKHLPEKSVLIIDDTDWSADMRKAWLEIKETTASAVIDLYTTGIVFINKELPSKVFKIRMI